MTNSNRKVSILRGALGVAVLSAALAGAAVPEHRHPLITAPWLAQAPHMDGRIEKAEWLPAAQGLPLIDRNTARLTEDLTVYWVGYTEDALHLAFRVNRPLYALAPSPADRIEFFVQPGEQGPDYWFCLNADGVTREGIRHQTTDQGWGPPWRHALQATATGWEGELSIPFASLGLAGAPTPGAVWRLLIVDQRLTPAGEQAFSSWLGDGGAWPAKQHMGRLRFGAPAEPAIRALEAGPVNPAEAGVMLETIGGAGSAALRLEAGVYRATGTATHVQDSGAGGDIWIPVTAELNFFQLLETGGLAGALEYYEPVEEWAVDLDQEAGVARRFPWLTSAVPGNY
ncbi:MAG: hypothetical protein K9N49_09170, partial [Candidatus Marinimicrobia bacterium]|nr:hypothetical protein [Candidatus Neomarinimicrobiota bacterium]